MQKTYLAFHQRALKELHVTVADGVLDYGPGSVVHAEHALHGVVSDHGARVVREEAAHVGVLFVCFRSFRPGLVEFGESRQPLFFALRLRSK